MHTIYLLLFSLVQWPLFAQHIVRSSLNTFGNATRTASIYLTQTAGQGSLHTSASSDNLLLRQGFQQPPIYQNSQQNSCLVSVFPNPNNGRFYVQALTTENEPYTIALADANGRSIMHTKAEESRAQRIDFLQGVPSGVYFMQLHNAKGLCATQKLIVTP